MLLEIDRFRGQKEIHENAILVEDFMKIIIMSKKFLNPKRVFF